MISLCWRPTCSSPQNEDSSELCLTCKTPLLLQKRYRARQVLSKNAQGRTILATDGQQRALVLLKQFRTDDSIIARTVQLQKLPSHPNISMLLDRFTENDYYYWVQEYRQGKSLAARAQENPFTESQIWQVLIHVLPLLHFLHNHQVIHGDITPENILLSGSVFELIDIDMLAGDPQYASPEQLQGFSTYASDIYSLGLTCVYLLWGISPFQKVEAWTSIGLEYQDQVLQDILTQMTAPDLLHRFTSVQAVVDTIERRKAIKVPVCQYPSPVKWSSETLLISPALISSTILALAIHPSQPLLLISREDQTLHCQNWLTKINYRRHFSQPIEAVASSAHLLVAGDRGGNIYFLNWDNLAIEQTFFAHHHGVKCIALHHNERILTTGGKDNRIQLWTRAESTQWQSSGILTVHHLPVNSLSFSPDGEILVSGSMDSTIILWDWQEQVLLHRLEGHTWLVEAVTFHPNGQLLASAGLDNTIRLWEVATGKCIKVFNGHSWRITSLAFTPDGQTIVSGSWDKTIRFWSIETGHLIETISTDRDSITCLQLHKNRVFIGSKEGRVTSRSRVDQFNCNSLLY